MKNTIARRLPASAVTFVPAWHVAAVRTSTTVTVPTAGATRANGQTGAAGAAAYKPTTHQVASLASSPPV